MQKAYERKMGVRYNIPQRRGYSNGSRSRLWKVVLQELANETGLNISICYFPPGTSKLEKIEHRMFSYITQNWCGKPLVRREVLVNLIGNTTTKNGLKIKSQSDKKSIILE